MKKRITIGHFVCQHCGDSNAPRPWEVRDLFGGVIAKRETEQDATRVAFTAAFAERINDLGPEAA
ncbi:hypothetical protein dsx2_2610 [Desulfovibrio sp. X2]|uniref:hypothetical protein n=1 Tax=Desulfovibrio sp. X2 TaxID=941449 RepID=UPI00035891F4|nr:hypothetical protein [Desulfovibrio sp. X2]EPR42693.1 hypothetical protein dsx2_2610 [Desulfovibrio sp. X2]